MIVATFGIEKTRDYARLSDLRGCVLVWLFSARSHNDDKTSTMLLANRTLPVSSVLACLLGKPSKSTMRVCAGASFSWGLRWCVFFLPEGIMMKKQVRPFWQFNTAVSSVLACFVGKVSTSTMRYVCWKRAKLVWTKLGVIMKSRRGNSYHGLQNSHRQRLPANDKRARRCCSPPRESHENPSKR